MTPDQAAWVRDHAWPSGLIRTEYRHEQVCSCEWPCECEKGNCNYCLTPDNVPAEDIAVAFVYGSRYTAWTFYEGGLQHRQSLASVLYLPTQRPCRLLCRCTHEGRRREPITTAPEQSVPAVHAPAVRRARPVPVGQLGLFEGASA
ncbi:DUF6248 family natural product biosynthesis protein [Streptomyces acidiscabies]|uniref:DUF6248 family natural product biosynthesis protein n=1 Tax=Streptomyces acidiscabies TaxID=42234 RepID=A0ABU4LWR2_9ACTN|nr:DUF6248 family natural product biosynthesis protein [Streptomyces acidiscabies]MDX3019907.1 DUF6248 family natural product biosynthesis protein [Streptomyces acidiscabies]